MSSDISDVDEDAVVPVKRHSIETIQHIVSKGWNNRSRGFDGLEESLKTVPPTKQFREEKQLISFNEHYRKKSNKTKRSRDPCSSSTPKRHKHSPQSIVLSLANRKHHPSSDDYGKARDNSGSEADIEVPSSPNVEAKHSNIAELKPFKIRNWSISDLSNSFELAPKQKTDELRWNKTLCVDLSLMDNGSDPRSDSPVDLQLDIEDRSSDSLIIGTYSSATCGNRQKSDPIDPVSSQSCGISQISENNIRSVGSNSSASQKSARAVKASDWLQNIPWQKDGKPKPSSHSEDKPNRVQKFVSGGLAEQALKLENRQRTARLIWAHDKAKKSQSKSLRVLLLTCKEDVGFTMAKCAILKKPAGGSSSRSVCLGSKETLDLPPVEGALTQLTPKGECMLMLKLKSFSDQRFQPGTIVDIFPPWQTLSIPDTQQDVILCTYFIELPLGSSIAADSDPRQSISEEVIYRKIHNSDPCSSSTNSISSYSKLQQRIMCSDSSKPNSKMKDFQITKPSIPSQLSKATSDVEANCLPSSYRQAILPCQLSLEEGTKMTFSARIQRVWQYKTCGSGVSGAVSNLNCVLLLQDAKYKFWVLHLVNFNDLPEDNVWSEISTCGLGKCFKFSDVEVVQKLHYRKHPHLFAFFKKILHRQQTQVKAPFSLQLDCYKIRTCCRQSSMLALTDRSFPSFTFPRVSTLNAVESSDLSLSQSQTPSRFTGLAKVICEFYSFVYVCDKSLQSDGSRVPYVKLSFEAFSSRTDLSPGCVVLIQEALIKRGCLFVDKYSKLVVLTPPDVEKVLRMLPNPEDLVASAEELSTMTSYVRNRLVNDSCVGDICLVSGIVTAVDRETALSWLLCSYCSKGNLYEDGSSRIYCEPCDRIIDRTVLMMRMNVILSIESMSSAIIYVELSCPTTKKILQISENHCQPSCDIQQVVGKKLEPFLCYLKKRSNDGNRCRFHLVEVIFS